MRVGIVGATGLVGLMVLRQMETSDLPVDDLVLMATSRSAGQELDFRDESIAVQEVEPGLFQGLDLVFFAIGTSGSLELVPEAVRRGATVIDKSNAFRMEMGVPLIVPQVNPGAAREHRGILASPNCSTIQLVLALKPLHDHAHLSRVVVTTFQSVSGSGRDAVDELREISRSYLDGVSREPSVYPHSIAFNLIPHIDTMGADGYTLEENKMRYETRKILDLPDLDISATCVRVPVMVGHSESVLVETTSGLSPWQARQLLSRAPTIEVVDDPDQGIYPMPRDVEGRDEVLVGRIRSDQSAPHGLWMWVVADNLRRGAATNAVDIARLLVMDNLI